VAVSWQLSAQKLEAAGFGGSQLAAISLKAGSCRLCWQWQSAGSYQLKSWMLWALVAVSWQLSARKLDAVGFGGS